MSSPLRFISHFRALVWGGRGLGESLGKQLPTGDAYGESWEVSDHDSHSSVVANGSLAGHTLRDLMLRDCTALLGSGRERFPWLVKFLDAHDWLSVQVHPDDKAAVHINERFSGRFRRVVTLADDVDPNSVSADYHDGLLHIHVKRHESAQPRRITVQ